MGMHEEENACSMIKNTYSVILLIVSIALIMGLIFQRDTKFSNEIHPIFAFVAIWGAIIWLTMVEGGQGSLVGLTPVDPDLYKESHKMSYRCTKWCHAGDNLDRYLMGRQFMVVLIVFVVNNSGNPLGGATLWGLPDWALTIFFGIGGAMVLFTCMVGQLNSQVNGCRCMLDYINNYFAYFTLFVAMAIEFSGILHASYLVAMMVSSMSGKPLETNEPPRSGGAELFFWARCLLSVVLLVFAGAVTIVAVFQGKTTMWESLPGTVGVVVFLVLMCVVGMLEAMQIAFFACAKLTKEERGSSKFAKMTAHLLFKGEGRNLPGFMVGRQLFVVTCMFVVARITSLNIVAGEGNNMFGVPDAVQEFMNTGLLGAFFLTIMGSISWQLVASAFPIAFMSNPVTYLFLNIALAMEATGICNGAWVLAKIHASIAGFQRDEVYIGTAEERAAAKKDDASKLSLGVGHMTKLPAFADQAPEPLRQLLESDRNVRKYMEDMAEEGNASNQIQVTQSEEMA